MPAALRVPPAVVIVGVGLVALAPVLARRWTLALGAFLVWLVVEDLVRKLAGNDLRVYFVKDIAYLLVLASLFLDPAARGVWRRATGTAAFWLYGLIAWSLVMSVPTWFEDWRLPLVGLRLDFFYAPLVIAGFLAVSQKTMVYRALRWVAGLTAVSSSVGIIQGVVGPGFLAPEVPTPGLIYLNLVRYSATAEVYRPTGTFVTAGRFLSLSLIGLAVALALLAVTRGRDRRIGFVAVAVNGAAVWTSGGRAGFLAGALLVGVAVLAPAFAKGRSVLGPAFAAIGAGVAALLSIALLFPGIFASRLTFYSETLDPRAAGNEWAFRWDAHSTDTLRGISLGGLLGKGTGRESLGKQYLYGGEDYSLLGLYEVEAGYGSVAVELGIIGLVLWCGWTIAWLSRAWRSVRLARGSPFAAGGLILMAWMVNWLVISFFGGLASFQNYIPNAYFWLISGVLFGLPMLRDSSDLPARPADTVTA